MAKSYLRESTRAVKAAITAAIGSTSGFLYQSDVEGIFLGAMVQRQGSSRVTDAINVVFHHVTHNSESMTDGRVKNTHYYEIEVMCRDARKAMVAADEIYDELHGRSDTVDPNWTHYFYPESVGIQYNDQDYYMATVSTNVSVTEN